MKMEYILIKNRKVKESKEGNSIIIPSSPLALIERNFDDVNINKTSNIKEELLRSNWSGQFSINNTEAIFSIKQYSKHKLSYLSISVKGNNVTNLELIDEKVNSIMSNGYIVITSYDYISEFYCNKIYKKLNNFERKLKELIFDIYTFSYGMNYYEKNFSEDLKLKVKKLRDTSISSEAKDIEQLKQSLYALDYNDIIKLLFTPKWLDDDEKDKVDLISQIKNEEMSSKQLINYINTIRPKSDWDRLFVPQIGKMSNIEKSIDELRELRNRVAHCKFFRKKHYENCLSLLRTLNRRINKALKIVMAIDFQELNAEYAYNSFEVLTNSIREFGKSISKIILSSLEPLTAMAVNSTSNTLKILADSIVPTLLYSPSNSKPTINGFKRKQNKKYTKNKNI